MDPTVPTMQLSSLYDASTSYVSHNSDSIRIYPIPTQLPDYCSVQGFGPGGSGWILTAGANIHRWPTNCTTFFAGHTSVSRHSPSNCISSGERGKVPLLSLPAFTYPSSEETWLPIGCWVNRMSLLKIPSSANWTPDAQCHATVSALTAQPQRFS